MPCAQPLARGREPLMAVRSQKTLASALAQLAAAPNAPSDEASLSQLREALAASDPRMVAQAAELIAKHGLRELEPALVQAYRALADERPAHDPGCHAKEALVIALETLEHAGAELFADAAVHVQIERSKNHERDTGARVRARGLLGLARVGHTDFMPIAGAGLGDREPLLRLAAAQAIAHRGQRDGAGLLLLRLQAGDEVPEIASECLRGLFVLAPEHARRYADAALRTASDVHREHLLHALGSANDERAIELLASELARAPVAADRAAVIEALSLSRRSSARELLLSLIREGRTSDASVALRALAIHRYDPRLREQLAEATAHSRELAHELRELMND
jgi:hypothetical protein